MERLVDSVKFNLMNMGLNEYQASALSHLLFLGETKATTLRKVSGIPASRVYDVLNDLVRMGLIMKRPGRPSLYEPRPPEEIISSLMALQREELRNKLQSMELKAKGFIEDANNIYLKGVKGTKRIALFRLVSVGKVSLAETGSLYDTAVEEILILSKSLEYYQEVEKQLRSALERHVSIRIILMNPELMTRKDSFRQEEILNSIKNGLGEKVELRLSNEVPIRGSVIDPDKGGQAIFLVEDPGVPLLLREAAITTHRNVVKGLAIMFNLIWEYKSKAV